MKANKDISILYVDDEPANLRSFKSAFRRIYQVHLAESPAQGMEIVKNTPLHIVVSDHRMPELMGTDFLREVKKINDQLIRIILSGFVKKEELIAANEEFGIHAYISKPWDFEHVNGIFQELLSKDKVEKMKYE